MLLVKKVIPFVVMSSFMVAGNALSAEPSQGTTVTFDALIRAASCNVSSTTEGSTINWGVFTADDVASSAIGDKLGADKPFSLELSNCTAALAANETINVYARGNKSNFDSSMFANSAANSLGVKLTSGSVNIVPNAEAGVKITKDITEKGNATIPMTAGLYLTNGAVQSDTLNVPVTFTVAYN